MKIFLFFISLIVCNCSYSDKLRVRKDGTFLISQITDLHYGEGDDLDDKTTTCQENVLTADHPDFVAFTGDLVAGYATNGSQGWYKAHWDKFTAPVTKLRIPYGIAMGNHDNQADADREQILKYDATNNYSMTQRGPVNITGVTNYYLPIYDISGKTIEFFLWFFDSMDHYCHTDKSWGCVGEDTVAWYELESAKLKKKYQRIIPGLAFLHIPPPEYLTQTYDLPINGTKEESVACPLYNTELVSTMKKSDNVMGLFAGHDHDNDYSVPYNDKLTLFYGRKTGYGCYGPISVPVGSRMIKLNSKDHSYSTYIRNVDGSITTYDKSYPVPKQDQCGSN